MRLQVRAGQKELIQAQKAHSAVLIKANFIFLPLGVSLLGASVTSRLPRFGEHDFCASAVGRGP